VSNPNFGQDPFGGTPFGGSPFDGGFSGGPPPPWTPPPPPPPPDGSQVNRLTTLSVVFAFLFAPAGAVLGHLGLSQVKRTGERGRDRALVGITLSYTVIALTVVALTVWATSGAEPAPPLAGSAPKSPASTATTASASPRTSKPSIPPVPQPPLTAGRTVTAADLPGLVSSLEEVKASVAQGLDHRQLSGLTAAPPATTPEVPPGVQGTVTPADCTPVLVAGSDAAYRDSGYTALYSVTMTDTTPDGPYVVTQAVVAFPDMKSARDSLEATLNAANQCALQNNPGATPSDSPTIVDPDGGPAQSFGTAAPVGPTSLGSAPIYEVSGTRLRPEGPAGSFYDSRRTLLARGNVVVDIAVRAPGLDSPGMSIAADVLGRLV